MTAPRRKALATAAAQTDESRLLTVKEVGQRLGVSHDSVARLLASGALRAIDVRTTGTKARLRVSEAELQRFLRDREIPTASRRASR